MSWIVTEFQFCEKVAALDLVQFCGWCYHSGIFHCFCAVFVWMNTASNIIYMPRFKNLSELLSHSFTPCLYGLRTFPWKSLSRKDVSRTVTFPENHFPGKIVFYCFNVKPTLIVFCVNWWIILLTGLLSLIREVMQRGPALLIFTMSALRGQVPAHQ